jgi:endonuclease/exonuclease/phosphatase family metal-dependent hydrolase
MKILTWNILAEEWIEPEYYPTIRDFSVMDSDKRITLILKKLNTENADIMLLQEVTDVHYDQLYKYFNRTYYISSLRAIQWTKSKTSSGNITLVRKRLCKTIYEIPLDYGVFVKADDIAIYNVHLDDISFSKRKNQIDRLRPRIAKETYVVLGGDFNQEFKENNPLYKLSNMTVHNTCITYFIEKNMNIDNILTKGFMASKEYCPHVPSNVTQGIRMYGSDHLPVIAVINPILKK